MSTAFPGARDPARRRRAVWILALCLTAAACSGPDPDPEVPTLESGGLLAWPDPDLDALPEAERPRVETLEREARAALRPGGTREARADAFGAFGRAALAAEWTDVARACFVNAGALQPDAFEWPYLAGHVARGEGDLDRAIAAFERAARLDPSSVPALAWWGRSLGERLAPGDADRAVEVFERLLELEPASAVAEYQLGKLALERGDHREAVERLKRALERVPGATVVHYPLALAYRGLGRNDDARRHLERRGETDLFPEDPWMDRVRATFASAEGDVDRAARYLAAERFDEAVEAYRAALRRDPTHVAARVGLGTARALSGDWTAARDAWREARALEPEHAPALHGLAAAAERAGDDDAALAGYRAAVASDPGLARAWTRIGEIERRRGNHGDAVDAYDRALAIDPLDATSNLGRILASVRLGDWDRGLETASTAATRLPEQPAFAHVWARLCVTAPVDRLRDPGRAATLLRDLQSDGGGNTDLAETIAMAMAEAGRFDEAIRWQSRVVEAVAGDPVRSRISRQRLARYRNSRPCRDPFPPNDPIHVVTRDAPPAPIPVREVGT